jgi:hypothetical protein
MQHIFYSALVSNGFRNKDLERPLVPLAVM